MVHINNLAPARIFLNELHCNEYGGVFRNGETYPLAKKVEVARALAESSRNFTVPANKKAVARTTKVSRWYVLKVEREIQHDLVTAPPKIKRRRLEKEYNWGSESLDDEDITALLYLYGQEPSRSLSNYRENLMGLTGCDVSTATISRFLNWSCPFKGSLCNGNIVPVDKFRPDNFLRATEYLDAISRISPYRLKFGDEKLLKGAEVYCRKNRRNPLNGVVPPIVTNSDFRNT